VHPFDCPHTEVDLTHADAMKRTFGASGGDRPRDSQRIRVYRSDTRLTAADDSALLGSVAEVQTVVDEILATAWWRERAPHRTTVRVTDGRGRRTGCSIGSEIRLPRSYRSMTSILHELAHEWMWCPTMPGHGPDFAGGFVALVREFMGQEAADRLTESFAANRVRVVDPT
jgi:putative metallohydrolase (TIGR04338 family)